MSCAAVTVNRSLILLAAMWGVISSAIFHAVTMAAGPEEAVALHGLREPSPVTRPAAPGNSLPCRLEGSQGLLPAFSLAISQPKMKKASVTNGR